ncbi:hypothetical protein MJT46_012663 [Ovis ammon polii x Ovis aries]|nr:hypothetical protein MJT46_012663 [Ovis ammon polii x Ovis aries]
MRCHGDACDVTPVGPQDLPSRPSGWSHWEQNGHAIQKQKCKTEESMEAQFLEMPRSASQTPSSPSVPRPWGPVEAGGEEGHDVFSPSWWILRVDLLSSSLAKDHFACLFSPSDQRRSLPTPLLSEAGPLDFASAFSLQPLLLVAPGLQSSERSTPGPRAMAGLRNGHRSCIRAAFTASTRAGFQKRQRNRLHRLKASHKKNHLDFVEGIWREKLFCRQLLDPFDADWEDARGHASCHLSACSLGAASCDEPLHMLKSRGPGDVSLEDPLSANLPVLVLTATGWASAAPEASDVDMQPVEASRLEARGRMARLSGPPEDSGMMEEDRGSPEAGRPQGRARRSRPPPRLGTERDRGPKLPLSKRKLELLLAEPEKSKRKKQYVV